MRINRQEIALPERVIPDSERLVPKNFRYGRRQIEEDVVRGVDWVDETGSRFDGYPQHGLVLSEEEYRRERKRGSLLRRLVGKPGKERESLPYFVDHYGRYDAPGVLNKNAEDVWELPTNGFPLHPFAYAMLTKSKLGVLTGPGYYWNITAKHGEQTTGDAFIVKIYKEDGIEKGAFAAIKGRDRRGWALLGGDNDTGETTLETAIRESWEEGGVNLRGKLHALIRRRTVVGDWRTTVNAWPVTDAYIFLLDERNQGNTQLIVEQEAKGEVKEIAWKPLTKENVAELSFHANIARLGVLTMEKKWGVVVDKNGHIGRSSSRR